MKKVIQQKEKRNSKYIMICKRSNRNRTRTIVGSIITCAWTL